MGAPLDHLALVEDPRGVRRITHRLDEILLLVCGTIANCDDCEDIATSPSTRSRSPDRRSIESRRKIAGWDPDYRDAILTSRHP